MRWKHNSIFLKVLLTLNTPTASIADVYISQLSTRSSAYVLQSMGKPLVPNAARDRVKRTSTSRIPSDSPARAPAAQIDQSGVSRDRKPEILVTDFSQTGKQRKARTPSVRSGVRVEIK